MSRRAHGQVRRSQLITTWGPGALIDLPDHAGIVGGLDTWSRPTDEEEITEPRLARKLRALTGLTELPRLYAPPAVSSDPREPRRGITVWRFPEWFLVQERDGAATSRRLVHRKQLDEKGRYEGLAVIPTRFVAACPKGHVADVDWRFFVHGPGHKCFDQLWLDEQGTTGDLGELVVRCECKQRRRMSAAMEYEAFPLGSCRGQRPWLGRRAEEECDQPARLLIRTATNAYFAQAVAALSLPERGSEVEKAVQTVWSDLGAVDTAAELAVFKKKPTVKAALARFTDDEVMEAIRKAKGGPAEKRAIKEAELEAILAAPEGYGDDIPVEEDFHARRLPGDVWRKTSATGQFEGVIQLHRLREVIALSGFTRFEPVVPDIHGEYEGDAERAQLALEPEWFPAVENRGEGLFLQVRQEAIRKWLQRDDVKRRLEELQAGHERWNQNRKAKRAFPGGPYVLLHTLSHLLIHSVAMRCGYPASSIRERIYAEELGYGILLYTGSPDAEGTLGGLVQQARYVDDHLAHAMRAGALCSNDPICAQHSPGEDAMDERWLHGAACHGCALIAETSCEMRNDYLDRALVVPTLDGRDAAFFRPAR